MNEVLGREIVLNRVEYQAELGASQHAVDHATQVAQRESSAVEQGLLVTGALVVVGLMTVAKNKLFPKD